MPVITVRGAAGPPVAYRFDNKVITIGRSKASDLLLLDRALSRLHAEIRRCKEGWIITDLGSRNGTLLNGKEVLGGAALSPGDEITLGRTVLLFDVEVEGALPEGPDLETLGQTGSGRGTGKGRERLALVGRSPAMREMLAAIEKVAPSAASVLITGESGTGKELVARLIHARSPRAARPFTIVNCPALAGSLFESELFGVEKGVATGVEPRPGRLEMADGGTLLLDEIGDLDPAAQAKLLRFLQDKTVDRVGGRKPQPVDVRVLAATNHDLASDMARGAFRRDLYHRLNVVTVNLPPLRERGEDIALLVEHFLSRSTGNATSMSREALQILARYSFPGNVRELEHLIERACLLAGGPAILIDDLPPEVRQAILAAKEAEPPQVVATRLFEKIVEGEGSFWEVAHRPFLRRQISGEEMRSLVRLAYERAGWTYKGMARLFRIEDDYKKLVNFLRNHKIRVTD